MKKIIIWLIAIGLVSAAAVWLYLFYFGAKHKDPLDARQIPVDASKLYEQYETNEDSANTAYLGKVIRVSGEVDLLEVIESRYTVHFKTSGIMGTVICEMDTTENSRLEEVKTGDILVVAGFCNGYNTDVYLDRCKLAE